MTPNMDNWQSIARKGRRGDSRLREVGGRVSHVNQTEAQAIDWLGPLGEAWVQSIGSGTTNPETGMDEYWPKFLTPPKKVQEAYKAGDIGGMASGMWDTNKGAIVGMALGGPLGALTHQGIQTMRKGSSGTWRPSQGKWGIFGQTKASKKRDAAVKAEAARKATFKTFVNDNEDKNIAEMYTNASGGEGAVEDLMTASTDTTKDASTMSSKNFTDVISPYDTRQEDELLDATNRSLDAKGSESALGTYGLLTASSTANTGVDQGNFGKDLEESEMMAETDRGFDQIYADAESQKTDVQDGFNEQFWSDALKWSDAKSA